MKAKELCTWKAGPWWALHSDSIVALCCVLMYGCVFIYMCVCVCVCGVNLKSTFLLCSLFPSASSHHINTVAMATILIDPVPSNTKCFSKPKLKQSGGRQWLAGELTAPAEEHDGSGVGFLSLLVCQSYCEQWQDGEFSSIKFKLSLSCARNVLCRQIIQLTITIKNHNRKIDHLFTVSLFGI